jgi:hypothetical protein
VQPADLVDDHLASAVQDRLLVREAPAGPVQVFQALHRRIPPNPTVHSLQSCGTVWTVRERTYWGGLASPSAAAAAEARAEGGCCVRNIETSVRGRTAAGGAGEVRTEWKDVVDRDEAPVDDPALSSFFILGIFVRIAESNPFFTLP